MVLWHLLRLYRIDAALVTLFSFLFGVYLSGNAFTVPVCLVAAGVSLVSVNFIYSVNSYFDRHIDAINKPDRPLASGSLSLPTAKAYIALLFVLSVAYPVLVGRQTFNLLLLWVFPVLGLLYSNPWYPLKKVMFAAPVVTALILVLPMYCGAAFNGAVSGLVQQIVFMFFMYCLVTVTLKDIEDVKGDVALGSQNWAHAVGGRKLVMLVAAAYVLLTGACIAWLPSPVSYLLAAMCSLSLVVLLLFLILKWPYHKIYRTIIASVIVSGFIFYFVFPILGLFATPIILPANG